MKSEESILNYNDHYEYKQDGMERCEWIMEIESTAYTFYLSLLIFNFMVTDQEH